MGRRGEHVHAARSGARPAARRAERSSGGGARSPSRHLNGRARPVHVPEPVQQQRVRTPRQRREIELREHADEHWMPYLMREAIKGHERSSEVIRVLTSI